MKKYIRKILVIVGILGSLCLNAVYAHPGRTDANGGHKDNKNKSGLGSYHYHCGGYPAHLHTNGVCPYSSSGSKENSSSSSKSENKGNSNLPSENKIDKSSNTSSVSGNTKETNIVNAEDIKINENVTELKIGETKQLTVSIFPTNTTDKKVVWKSSDENIVLITESGQITAKSIGNATISVSTSNGKKDTIEVIIKEIEDNYNNVSNTLENIDRIDSRVNNNSEDLSPVAGIITLGVIGGGGYWAYKKHKKEVSNH